MVKVKGRKGKNTKGASVVLFSENEISAECSDIVSTIRTNVGSVVLYHNEQAYRTAKAWSEELGIQYKQLRSKIKTLPGKNIRNRLCFTEEEIREACADLLSSHNGE